MAELSQRRCVPCEGGTPPLNLEESRTLLKQVRDWELLENKSIRKRFKFRNFIESMTFVNSVAQLAETEGHHPDIHISWNRVTLTLTTHAIGGLSENDFIMAAKIDRLD